MEIGSGIIIFTKIIPLLKGNGFPSMTIERILFMKNICIEKIWYEFLEIQSPVDHFDCNSDVIFELNDGSKWVATFFTYKNIETLRKKNQLTGECLNGTYFCATDMILISEMSEKIIKAVLDEMISNDEIEIYCQKI